MPAKKTLEQFIREAREVHGDFYDYSLVNYVTAHTKIDVICPIHGKFDVPPYSHLNGHHCKKCAKEHRINTTIKNLGVKYPLQNAQILEKSQQTCLANNGVRHPLQNDNIKQKQEQTMIDKFDHSNASQVPFLKEKRIQTNLKNWQVSYIFQNSQIQQQIRQTHQEKYNGHHTRLLATQLKRQTTNQSKYDCQHASQSIVVKNKIRTTMESKSGSRFHRSVHIVEQLSKLDNYDWLYHEYVELGKSAVQIANELRVRDSLIKQYLTKYAIDVKITQYSSTSTEWITSIIESSGVDIQHAGNGGEFQIPGTKYKADGYCAETNTIYEFHGDYWHGNPKRFESTEYNSSTKCTMGELYERTLKKEQKIRELGYNLVTIWESDWKQIKQQNGDNNVK